MKKSVHDRGKFMRDKLIDYGVSYENAELILEDFAKVKEVLESLNDGKKNIGHYDFLILRLASRRGIEIKEPTEEELVRIKDNKVERLIWKKVSKDKSYQGNSREAQQMRNDRKELEFSKYLENRDE